MADKYQFKPLARGMDQGETARSGLQALAENPDVTAFVAAIKVGGVVHLISMADSRGEMLTLLEHARRGAGEALQRLLAEELAAMPPAGMA